MHFPKSYALVLSGGGAKGAYQIGAMNALKEMGVRIDSVVGASVGALNGALWVMNMLPQAEKMWREMRLDHIVEIPPALMKDGNFHVTNKNTSAINEMIKNIGKKGGLSTAPLKNIIHNLLDEKHMRSSRLEFGLISYQLEGFKAIESFLEDIPEGKLEHYLMASAAFPGFQVQKINGKVVLDGGLSDNIPFSMASRRGHKNIIILDVSGPGVNRRPQMEHHNIVYIKNSRDTGGVLDFDPKQAAINIRMGYLDTLKIFDRVQGIDLFLKPDKAMEKKLYKTLMRDDVIEKYKAYLAPSKKGHLGIEARIRQVLPEKVRIHKSLVIALMECAVRSLNLDCLQLYTWKEILELICQAHKAILARENAHTRKKDFFSNLRSVIKDTPRIFSLNPVEYNKLMDFLFGKKQSNPLHTRALSRFIPELAGAKIFLKMLDCGE